MNASVVRSGIQLAVRSNRVSPLGRGRSALLALLSISAASAARCQSAVRDAVGDRAPLRIPAESTYTTDALRALVSRVAATGRQIPAGLLRYTADVESEIGIALRTAAPAQGIGAAGSARDQGHERVLQVEQVASELSWARSGTIEQHVVGYRSRAVTTTLSALTVMRRPWVVPVLYGNRLQLLLEVGASVAADSGSATSAPRRRGTTPLLAIHPFATDRDSSYQFSGGDTVTVVRLGKRDVTLVRILVEPRAVKRPQATLRFSGAIDVDAERAQVVRMHGRFVVAGTRRSLIGRVLAPTWRSMAFADLQNGEFDGQFWLPTTQRIETQVRSVLASNFSPIVRVVSRFRGYGINGISPDTDHTPSVGDTVTSRAHLTFATRDTLDHFGEWYSELGAATSTSARASDFDDVVPDNWRPQGTPMLEWRAERVNDVFRFNRVEGAFTGIAAALQFRDAAPGLTVGAHAGWAWKEETARGALFARLQRPRWTISGRAERALVNTNDFRPPLDYEQSLMAMLVTADDYDYLDRASATIGFTRTVPVRGAPTLHVELGPARDAAATADVQYGLIHLDSAFRNNRAIAPGSYFRTALGVELHPEVTGDFLGPGVGASFWYERGDGQPSWQRIETRVTARHSAGRFTYAGRLDGIAVISRDVVPQMLIEFGETEGLPGYAYKEFGGDRAALLRGAVEYRFPWLSAPIRFGRSGRSRFVLPGLAPSLAVGGQAGWAVARQASTRAAMALFGTRTDTRTGASMLATRPTDGVRSTVSVTLRVFGGSFGIGLAKPLGAASRGRPWQFVIGAGQAF
jgi:hypothetical protein